MRGIFGLFRRASATTEARARRELQQARRWTRRTQRVSAHSDYNAPDRAVESGGTAGGLQP